jgi:hypothetical protein
MYCLGVIVKTRLKTRNCTGEKKRRLTTLCGTARLKTRNHNRIIKEAV